MGFKNFTNMVRFFTILVLANLLLSSLLKADGFEGSLQIIKTSYYDTTYIIYHIKDNKIRVEEYSSDTRLLNSYLIDIDKNIIYALDPENKLYKQIITKPFVLTENSDIEIIKSENFIYLNGYQCNQWRVRNKLRNTEIAYWVAKDDFFFYDKLLRLINYTDKTEHYFLFIPGIDGFMPMMAIERTVLRDEKSRYEVKRIEREVLDNSLFTIPVNYRQFN